MSIIIRLQNLPWDASTLNVRQFFHNLSIPDGGVHIIGGDKGDAFIAFSTDEDARQAMRRDGDYIGNTQIKLLLSSKSEMQSVIAMAKEAAQIHQEPPVRPPPFGHFNDRQSNLRSRDLDLETEASMKFQMMASRSLNSHNNDFESGGFSRSHYNERFDSFDAKKPFYEQNLQSAPYGMSGSGGGPFRGPPRDEPIKPLLDNLHKEVQKESYQRKIMSRHDRMANDVHRDSNKRGSPFRENRSFENNFKMENNFHDNFNNIGRDLRGNPMANLQNPGFPDMNYRNNSLPEMNYLNANFPNNNNNFLKNNNNNFFNTNNSGFSNTNNNSFFNNSLFNNNNNLSGFSNTNNAFEPSHEQDEFCVVLENVPGSYSYKDIKSLLRDDKFSSCNIKIDHDRQGRRNGQVFLRLPSIPYLENVMKLQGKLVHGMRIGVERCSARDYDNANEGRKRARTRSRSHSPSNKEEFDGFYVVIKNLPHKSIFKLLGEAKVAENGGPFAEVNVDGRDSGHVLAEMKSKADMQYVLAKFRKLVDNDVALIFQITSLEYQKRVRRGRLLTRENTETPVNIHHTCARIVGLSWTSHEANIRKFYNDSKILPNGIHLLLERDGTSAGTAYVEFETAEDCHRALKKDKQHLDGRYLVMSGQSRQCMVAQIRRCLDHEKSFKGNSVQHIKELCSDKKPCEKTIVYMRNLSYRTQLEEILEFFEGFQVLPDSVHLQYKDDIPTGDGMIKFDSRAEAKRAIAKLDRREMLGRTVHLMF